MSTLGLSFLICKVGITKVYPFNCTNNSADSPSWLWGLNELPRESASRSSQTTAACAHVCFDPLPCPVVATPPQEMPNPFSQGLPLPPGPGASRTRPSTVLPHLPEARDQYSAGRSHCNLEAVWQVHPWVTPTPTSSTEPGKAFTMQ